MSIRLRRRTRRRAEAELASAQPEGEPAHGPRAGALTVGASDGYQFRDDHSWDENQQQVLAATLENVAREADKMSSSAEHEE
jgi:hypothetical protein